MSSSQPRHLVPQPRPLVPPSLEQLKSVAAGHHLHISDEDLQQHHSYTTKLTSIYSELDKYSDESLPVKYLSPPGYPRAPAENPLNGWACLTNTQGASSGKLFGKTVAIKDNISMAGIPLTVSSAFLEGNVSGYNATVVDRVLDAGAVIKGKSVCEDLCFSGQSYTSVSGPVLNPHDQTRSSGGSSSGSAVLVASGEVDLAIGTDQGGSIRIPACWCGIVGLKPTHGLVPYTGIIPLESTLDHAGPMARTVQECALFLEVLAGADDLDPRQPANISSKNYTEFLTGEVDGLRVGLLKEGFEGSEPDVAELVRSVAHKLSQRGATVTEFSSPLQDQAMLVAIPILIQGVNTAYCSGGMTPLTMRGFKDVKTHDFMFNASKTNADNLPIGLKNVLLFDGYIKENYGSRYYAKAHNVLRSIVAGYEELFTQYDVIVMPTIKYKAPKLPITKLSVTDFLEDFIKNSSNTIPYDATGHPAVNVNAGFSEGLPVGMMIVGNNWEDEKVLKVAYAIEQIRDTK